jgi:hypothetical protein
MQIDVKNIFNIILFYFIFLENSKMSGDLWWALSLPSYCFMMFIFLFISNMKQDDLWRGPFFTLTHYQGFLKTIVQAPNCVFSSLADNTHIVSPINEIIPTFDHLLTQLALVGFEIKV